MMGESPYSASSRDVLGNPSQSIQPFLLFLQFIQRWQLWRPPPGRSGFGIVCVSTQLFCYHCHHCVFVVYWYRVVLLSVPPFFAHHQHTIRLIPAKSASANITWEPRPRNFFTSEIWRKKLPCDKNSSFSNMKKRGFYQIEKQITICCKLTGFSICLCWQEPLSASV